MELILMPIKRNYRIINIIIKSHRQIEMAAQTLWGIYANNSPRKTITLSETHGSYL